MQMRSSLVLIASAGAALSTPVFNTTLHMREIESSEYPNLQINTHGDPSCNHDGYTYDAQYGIKQLLGGISSYHLSRDLLAGEVLKLSENFKCDFTSGGFDATGKAAKAGCTSKDKLWQCYQLLFTSAAPSAPTAGVNQAACDFSYKVVMDGFVMRGKNFDRGKMKPDGSGLKKQVSGCGALTAWSFKQTPGDPQYQWIANGNLPVGTEACMGSAIKSAGGSSAGNCLGQG